MPEPSPNRGVMIVLAYLWPLALIPLLVDKQDAEVQWHARHGIVLMIAELILLIVYLAVTSVIGFARLGLGCALLVFLAFVWTAVLALHVAAIIKGINGGRLMVPRVSVLANRFPSNP